MNRRAGLVAHGILFAGAGPVHAAGRYIPTLHAAVGAQGRFGGEAIVSYPVWDVPDGDGYLSFDLVGTLGAGFDWRPPGDGDLWVVGGLATMQRALLTSGPSYEAMSLVVHVAYYFYP